MGISQYPQTIISKHEKKKSIHIHHWPSSPQKTQQQKLCHALYCTKSLFPQNSTISMLHPQKKKKRKEAALETKRISATPILHKIPFPQNSTMSMLHPQKKKKKKSKQLLKQNVSLQLQKRNLCCQCWIH